MSDETHRDLAHMSLSQLQRLNLLCNEFERQWQSGKAPRIAMALNDCADEDRAALLKLLVPLDIAYRRKAGETPTAADYQPKYDMIDAEWLARVLSDVTIHTRDQAATPIADSDSLLTAGARIGIYEILEPIGSGGMADVYRARHLRLQRDVALKLLRDSDKHGSKRHDRFQKETAIIGQLEHEHIVRAFDGNVHDNHPYLVTELVDGTDLSRMVKANGPLSIRKALACLWQAAKGLEYVHGQGVIHRDVKPSNLLIDGAGIVKVSDLGLAGFSQIHDDAGIAGDQTATDLVMGTVDYMAPEQARSAKQADARSDLYSLGCTLFYLLTGKPLFRGETIINRLEAHRSDPPPKLTDLRSDVPVAVEAMYQRMVAKKPGDRFQSMTELLRAIDAMELGESPSANNEWSFSLGDHSPVGGLLADSPTLPAMAIAGHKKRVDRKPNLQRSRRILFAVVGAITALVLIGVIAVIFGPGTDSDENHGNEKPEELVIPFGNPKQKQEQWAKYYEVPVKQTVELGDGVALDFVFIPPGQFRKGSTPDQIIAMRSMQMEIRDSDLELAGSEMTDIVRPFYLGTTEITVAVFRKFVESTQPPYRTTAERDFSNDGAPRGGYGLVRSNIDGRTQLRWEQRPEFFWNNLGEHPRGDNYPVIGISWEDAREFCQWLTRRAHENGEDVVYRLPTEAEWEFAARAGTDTIWFFGDDPTQLRDYAVHQDFENSVQFRPVGSKLPNPFGLYDIYGNQAEWCLDIAYPDEPGGVPQRAEQIDINRRLSERYRPQRGGGVMTPQSDCRSASVRFRRQISSMHGAFRIVREIPAK